MLNPSSVQKMLFPFDLWTRQALQLWRVFTFIGCVLLAGCTHHKTKPGRPANVAQSVQATTRATSQEPGIPGTLLEGVRRVVFLGDSITYSGQYVDYLEAALRAGWPKADFEFINLGLPSETVSGQTEPGHANGAFPRPTLHDRLGRILDQTRPDLVIACYGINDGIYYPFSDERFEKFTTGIQRLHERVRKSGARIIHVTPPCFDPVPIKTRTLPAGLAEYPQPYENYNDVLDRYAEWLLAQKTNGWVTIDAHFAMNEHLAERRRTDSKYVLASDGVHLNDTGHWLITQMLLYGLKIPQVSASAVMNFSDGSRGVMGDTYDAKKQDGALSFSWRTKPPLALHGFRMTARYQSTHYTYPPHGQTHALVIRGTEQPKYDLFENGKFLATVVREELADPGVDTRRFPDLITSKRSREILDLTRTKNALVRDAWLSGIGHKRPGLPQGLPVPEATAQAHALSQQIKELQRPVELHFRLAPYSASPAN
jgi:lysophospholipase L1-like esterase